MFLLFRVRNSYMDIIFKLSVAVMGVMCHGFRRYLFLTALFYFSLVCSFYIGFSSFEDTLFFAIWYILLVTESFFYIEKKPIPPTSSYKSFIGDDLYWGVVVPVWFLFYLVGFPFAYFLF